MQDCREEIIQAWYMDDSNEDQRLPHHREPKQFVSLDKLAGMSWESAIWEQQNYICLIFGSTLSTSLPLSCVWLNYWIIQKHFTFTLLDAHALFFIHC